MHLAGDVAALILCVGLSGCGEPGKPKAALPPHLANLDLLAGRPGGQGWVDGKLSDAEFADPWALVGDGHGLLYVADGNTIRVIDLGAGTVATLAGSYGVAGSQDGVGPQASLSKPSGLAIAGGKLYVADSENSVIREIDVKTAAVTTVAGAAHQEDTIDAVGTAARFRVPEGLVTDGSGTLYIGDTESETVRRMDLQSGAVTTIAGAPVTAGDSDGVGSGALFHKPRALALDGAGTLRVIDSLNDAVRKVDPVTQSVSTLVTFSAFPQGIAMDGSDVLVTIGDATVGQNEMVRVHSDGSSALLAGGMGEPGFVDAAGGQARFNSPAGMWNDGAGAVYVADNGNYVIRKITLQGSSVSTLAGADSIGAVEGTGAQARFDAPKGLAADDDAVYVADTNNHTIRKIALPEGAVTTLAGAAGQSGRADGPLGAARFDQPQGLALDSAARKLYVADTGNSLIRVVDLGAGQVTTLAPAVAPGATFRGFDVPSGLALDHGTLFVTDYAQNVVLAIDLQRQRVSTLAGNYTTPGDADGVGMNAGFNGPLGIAADGHGNLFVIEYQGYTVRRIVIAGATVSTVAGEPVVPGNSDGVGAAAHFYNPTGIAADGFGDLFVSDSNNNTVRHIDVSTGTVTTPIGTTAATGVRLGPLPAQLSQPSALAITSTGGLLVVSQNAVLIAH